MTKEKVRFLTSLLLLTVILLRCWTLIFLGEYSAAWRHDAGLVLYLFLLLLSYNNLQRATVALGIYLLLGLFNLIAFTPVIETTQIGIGPVITPPFQLLSLGLFALYFLAFIS